MAANWQRKWDVVEQALDLEPHERAAFIDEACGDDTRMRREIDELLSVHERSAGVPTGSGLVTTAIHSAERARALGVGMVVDGKYRIDAVIGAGGMGAVYRATHLQLERTVALKGIRSDLLTDRVMAERFRREAIAVARLRHPHIVMVHDYGVTFDAGAYLVMELLEGSSLREELVAGGQFDVATALAIMAQVSAAVGAAHRAGVIHRDLKPENIFLDRRDGALMVKVVDFGLAKLEAAFHASGTSLTNDGMMLGTPVYMSPEQCRGEEADTRSDVYSLGCVLYEMLTGERPFKGKNVWALVYQHVNEEPPRPIELVPDLPRHVDEAVMRALAKDPAARHQTAEAFAEALGLAEAGGVMPSGAGTPVEHPADNLPHAVTSFVGREREIDEVREWLERARLVTLVGPGGMGKTRLALETAARVLGEHEGGVWLVELASLSDPALVARAVASALGIREHNAPSELESIEAWLGDRRVLVVLDNCEHLVGACAELVERLLEASAGLRVLATSREALAVAGEAVWPVPALAVPSAAADRDALLECEAVRLFVDRAALAKPHFDVGDLAVPAVAELCRRLEGIPLAIELAAARVKVLSVDQILEKLDDRFRLLTGGSRSAPTRQRALQAALDWSHDLLTEEERALFRRLSVFAGGWTLEAASSVLSEEPSPTQQPALSTQHFDVFDVLARLVDKSLVTVHERGDTTRYGMLEMIREYASDLLSRSGEADAVRRRHAGYFHAQAEEARRAILAGQPGEWLERLEEEHDNVRAALAWLLESDPDGCLRLAAALNRFRELRGHLAESRQCLETALARHPMASAPVRVVALLSIGNVALIQGDVAGARGFLEQGLVLAKEAGETRHVAGATYGLGAIANMEGDLVAARARFTESLAIGERMGYADLIRVSLNSLGEVARLGGDPGAARGFYEQAVTLSRRDEDDNLLIIVLCNLGAVLCEGGDVDAAFACYEEALVVSHGMGSQEFLSLSLDGLAAVAAKRGGWERAGRLAGAAEALLDSIGAKLAPADRSFRERYLAAVREQLGEVALEAALADGRRMRPDQAVACALGRHSTESGSDRRGPER